MHDLDQAPGPVKSVRFDRTPLAICTLSTVDFQLFDIQTGLSQITGFSGDFLQRIDEVSGQAQ
jgi:hypothetical protein